MKPKAKLHDKFNTLKFLLEVVIIEVVLIMLLVLITCIGQERRIEEWDRLGKLPKLGNVEIKDIKCIDGNTNTTFISADWKGDVVNGLTYVYISPNGSFRFITFVRDFNDLNSVNHEFMHIILAVKFNNTLPQAVEEMICYPYGWIYGGILKHKPNLTECPEWLVKYIEWLNEIYKT